MRKGMEDGSRRATAAASAKSEAQIRRALQRRARSPPPKRPRAQRLFPRRPARGPGPCIVRLARSEFSAGFHPR